jgi:single-stranded DNA-binding protein
MKGIRAAFHAIMHDAEIKKSAKTGHEFLSLTVALQEGDDEVIKVAIFSKTLMDELVDKLRPDLTVYIEGVLKLRRWEDREGSPRAALQVSADRLEVLYDIDAKPKPRVKRADRPELAKPSLFTGPAPKHNDVRYDHQFDDPIPF